MAKKILIVDDEPHIRLLLGRVLEDLEDEGVELLTASNGAEALETIEAERPQLVFLDVMMPEMSGFNVCQAVKHELGIKDIYIIMLTAKGQKVDKRKGKKSGADAYVTKPFDPDEMLATAKEILGF